VVDVRPYQLARGSHDNWLRAVVAEATLFA